MSNALDKACDWPAIVAALDAKGFATTAPFLDEQACAALRSMYDNPRIAFRSTVDMARYNFGRGQYRYFDYPLPAKVQELREYFYAQLAPVANDWAEQLGKPRDWPATLAALTRRCHAAGQPRPTPLMLSYSRGDYNCLHQDLYGPLVFPLQVVVLLSRPVEDFSGGELVLVEQRPRMQSRPMVLGLEQGAAAVFPVRERPRAGKRGYHRVAMRHGVSELAAGNRRTLGLIFHDAA